MTDFFAPVENQKKIPIHEISQFEFTRRWFINRNQSTWSTFLYDRYRGIATNLLQIGVFEGMDLVWCLQHLLTHPHSRALAIDPWMATRKIDSEEMERVHDRAVENISAYSTVNFKRGTSQTILPELIRHPVNILGKDIEKGEWDLIIIDGDHTADAVYDDAVNAYELAAPGAWLVFDDVRNRIPKKDHVQAGLNRFRDEYASRVKTVWQHRYCDCLEKS